MQRGGRHSSEYIEASLCILENAWDVFKFIKRRERFPSEYIYETGRCSCVLASADVFVRDLKVSKYRKRLGI